MKKIVALLLCGTLALTAFSGCSKKAKLKFDKIEDVRNGVEDALGKEYKHLKISDDIKITVPDELYTYQSKEKELYFSGEDDPIIDKTISLLYDKEDFDEQKYPDDEIAYMPINIGTDDETYQLFNETKDEHVAINANGYVSMNSNEVFESQLIECDYVDNMQDDETYQNVLAAADPVMQEAVKLQSDFESQPYQFLKWQSESGNVFYEIYYAQLLDSAPYIPYGMESAFFDPMSSNSLQPRWHADRLEIWTDENYKVRGIHIDYIRDQEKSEQLEKIPTLDSVLNYLSKEIAPNMTLEITNIQLMYGLDNIEENVVPVWYIEFKSESEDVGEYNRVIVNCVTGNIASAINGTYDEHQG